MPTEPIRPEDHSVRGHAFEQFAEQSPEDWKGIALAEAIHQTFERDSDYIARITEGTVQWDGVDTERRPDPATEIDRYARLIVQGEYRRRRAESEGDQ